MFFCKKMLNIIFDNEIFVYGCHQYYCVLLVQENFVEDALGLTPIRFSYICLKEPQAKYGFILFKRFDVLYSPQRFSGSKWGFIH